MSTTKFSEVFTALDAWLYVCKFFIILGLLEFAWLLKIMKSGRNRGSNKSADNELKSEAWSAGRTSNMSKCDVDGKCRVIDYWAFYAYNGLYLVFCLGYWTFLLSTNK